MGSGKGGAANGRARVNASNVSNEEPVAYVVRLRERATRDINAAYVRDIRNRDRIATERTRINAYVNQRAITAVPASVVSRSQRVTSAARAASAARLADARPVMGTLPVRPAATTAHVSAPMMGTSATRPMTPMDARMPGFVVFTAAPPAGP